MRRKSPPSIVPSAMTRALILAVVGGDEGRCEGREDGGIEVVIVVDEKVLIDERVEPNDEPPLALASRRREHIPD
jgi:hypothetical protein